MTTNNHPANGPVSLERLHLIREILSKASAQSDGGNLGYAMADAVKVIDGAIASSSMEPYGYVHKGIYESCGTSCLSNDYEAYCNSNTHIALYIAPPAPVVPDEIDVNDPALDTHRKWMAEGWNRCCAAMLQAGNHTEQHLDMVVHSGDAKEKVDCRLPFDQWLSQQNEPIDVDCGCVTTEAFYHWLRVAYEAGNSPVTPDGWIPVSERIPEVGDIVLTAIDGCVNVGEAERSGANYRYFTSVISGRELPATHWQPLPSAPKEVG